MPTGRRHRHLRSPLTIPLCTAPAERDSGRSGSDLLAQCWRRHRRAIVTFGCSLSPSLVTGRLSFGALRSPTGQSTGSASHSEKAGCPRESGKALLGRRPVDRVNRPLLHPGRTETKAPPRENGRTYPIRNCGVGAPAAIRGWAALQSLVDEAVAVIRPRQQNPKRRVDCPRRRYPSPARWCGAEHLAGVSPPTSPAELAPVPSGSRDPVVGRQPNEGGGGSNLILASDTGRRLLGLFSSKWAHDAMCRQPCKTLNSKWFHRSLLEAKSRFSHPKQAR